jgi:hypothetical protein
MGRELGLSRSECLRIDVYRCFDVEVAPRKELAMSPPKVLPAHAATLPECNLEARLVVAGRANKVIAGAPRDDRRDRQAAPRTRDREDGRAELVRMVEQFRPRF